MAPGDSLRAWARPRAGLLGLLAATAVLYAASLRNGFVWDDWTLVVDNPAYRELRLGELLLRAGNGLEYLPVKDLSLALDHALWGARPFGFHLTNVLLYLAGVAAVHAATRRLAALFRDPHAGAVAFWAAAIFALHPLHAEVVNFVTARNTLLAGLLAFLSLHAVLAWLEGGRGRSLAAGLLLFVAAGFSKAIVVSYPAFVAALIFLGPRPLPARRKVAAAAAFLATGVAIAWVHARVAATTGMMSADALRFGTVSPGAAAAKALQIPFFYLRYLVAPHPLSVEYGVDLLSGAVGLRAAAGGAALAALCAGAWVVRRTRPLVALGVLWFLVALVPVLNFFPTHPVVADRYAYLAVYGFGLVLAAFGAGPLAAAAAGRRALLLVPAAIAAPWAGLVAARNAAWRSDVSLWESAVAVDPRTGRLHLAEALWQAGRHREAIAQLREAKRLGVGSYHPSFFEGRLALLEGRLDDAAAWLSRALQEGGDGNAELHEGLAQVQERRGALRAALEQHLRAAETADGMTRRSGEAGRAGAERLRARLAPELEVIRRRAEAAPRDPAAQAELAVALHALGAWDEAERHYRAALDLGPPAWQLWYNLGLTLMKRERCEEAIAAFERALALPGPSPDVLNNLGGCQMRLRRYRDAERTYLAALERFPDYLFATFNLGRTYFVTGDRERALRYLSRARALAAGDAALQERIDQYLRQLD